MSSIIGIIAGAGRGERFGGQQKQFRSLAGIPVIQHGIEAFQRCSSIEELIVILPETHVSEFLIEADKFKWRKRTRAIAGGASRMESVYRALKLLRATPPDIVAVHDAARPLITPEDIDRTVAAAQTHGAAILASAALDTVKIVSNERVVKTLDRSRIWHAQTPQCFRYELLWRAYEEGFTRGEIASDDSQLVEMLGEAVLIIPGDWHNLKITRPEDLDFAEAVINNQVLSKKQVKV